MEAMLEAHRVALGLSQNQEIIQNNQLRRADLAKRIKMRRYLERYDLQNNGSSMIAYALRYHRPDATVIRTNILEAPYICNSCGWIWDTKEQYDIHLSYCSSETFMESSKLGNEKKEMLKLYSKEVSAEKNPTTGRKISGRCSIKLEVGGRRGQLCYQKLGQDLEICTHHNNLKLEKERERTKKKEKIAAATCSICLDNIKDCLLNCGHSICYKCTEKVKECPICKVTITELRTIYNS